MNKEEKIIPVLRFPEFVDDEIWYEKTLDKVFNVYAGGDKPNNISKVKKKEYFIPILSNGIKDKAIYGWTDKPKVEVPSLTISARGTIGWTSIQENPFYPIVRLIVLSPKVDLNLKYAYYFMKTIENNYKVPPAGIPQLTKPMIKNVKFLFPISSKEQQKIANCLSSLDDVINAETEKLELLQDHKKGLLQQLFPQQGESQPKYRFPEFVGDGDWVMSTVGKYFEVCSSKRVLKKDWGNDGVPFYRTRELVSLSKNEPFGSEIFISENLFLELSQKYGVPKPGDFLVSGVGTLGISYQIQEGDKFYFKDGNVLWFKIGKGVLSNFFKYSFQTSFFQKQIFGQSSASTVGTYTITNARKTKFWISSNLKEQQKIANCLSSVDDLIESQQQKIEGLKAHKKGLLQKLFPTIKN